MPVILQLLGTMTTGETQELVKGSMSTARCISHRALSATACLTRGEAPRSHHDRLCISIVDVMLYEICPAHIIL